MIIKCQWLTQNVLISYKNIYIWDSQWSGVLEDASKRTEKEKHSGFLSNIADVAWMGKLPYKESIIL